MNRELFFDLLRTSAAVGAVTLALMLASPLWDRKFAARWKSRLWCVLAALLLAGPFLHLPAGTAPWTIPVPEEVLVARETGDYEPAPVTPTIHPEDIITRNPDGTVLAFPVGHEALYPPFPVLVPVTETVDLLPLAEGLWAVGILVFVLWQLGGELIFRRRVRRWAAPVQDKALLSLYQSILPEVSHPPLFVCPGIGTPMLAGLLRPRLFLPRKDYTPTEAACVFRHELTHLRRGDLRRKLLLLAANAVHWFNPAVWLLRREAERDMERACDEQVVRGAALEERRAYGAVLLSMAGAGTAPALSTHLSGGAKQLKRRLENILSGDKRRGAVPAAVCALLAVCAVVLAACGSRPAAEPVSLSPEPESAEASHILVLGSADTDGFYDTILLLTYDPAAPSLDILSIPRDTYVEALPWDYKKISSARPGETGADAPSMETLVAELTGSPVDHVVQVEPAAVERLVDAIGGLDCVVPVRMDYDDPYQDLSIHLEAGRQHLDGGQVMGLLRYRRGNDAADSYPQADLDRIATQQTVMETLMQKLLSGGISLTELSDLAELFHETAATDLSTQELLWLGKSLLSGGLAAEDITFRTLDGRYEMRWCDTFQSNLSYWVPAGPAQPGSYAYDPAAGEEFYLKMAQQLLAEAFSFDAGELVPVVDTGPQLVIRYAVSQTPLDVYVAEFTPGYDYPSYLYHFCHSLDEGGNVAEDTDFVFDTAMLDQARAFVKTVYGVDCSAAEARAYGYLNKISVQLKAADNQIFHVQFYYKSDAPVGVLFFHDLKTAQRTLDANNAKCFF